MSDRPLAETVTGARPLSPLWAEPVSRAAPRCRLWEIQRYGGDHSHSVPFGRMVIDPHGLTSSSLSDTGWWISGAPAREVCSRCRPSNHGRWPWWTPNAHLRPRAGRNASLHGHNWAPSDALVAGSDRTSADPRHRARQRLAERSDAAKGQTFRWHEGDRVLVMRLLGGIGGADREPTLATYHTCTNNPNGIVSRLSGQLGLRRRSAAGLAWTEALSRRADAGGCPGRGTAVALPLWTLPRHYVQDFSQALWTRA